MKNQQLDTEGNHLRGKSEDYVLEPEERAQLLAVCETLEERVCVKLPMFLGLRIGEAVHLNADWIRSDGQLSVPRHQACLCLECAKERNGAWSPKTKAGVRVIPIANIAWEDLKTLLAAHPGGLGPIHHGLGLTRGAAYFRIKRLMHKAKIRKVGNASLNTSFPHALRATAATLFAEIGFNSFELCSIMGWESIKVAERYINKAMAAKGAQDKLRKAGY